MSALYVNWEKLFWGKCFFQNKNENYGMIPSFVLLLLIIYNQMYLQETVLRIEPTETNGEECWWLDLRRSSGLSFVGILGLKQFDIPVKNVIK